MKIVIFAPHPDDELVAAGGSILKWQEEGHEINICYVSDGRAAYTFERKMGRLIETEKTQISEDDLAGIRMREIDKVIEFLGLPQKNIHKFGLPDQDVKNRIELGVEKSKPIIIDADRIVLPSNHNTHEDHQATFNIGIQTAQELNLENAEFYIYALYVRNKAPKDKQIKIKMKEYREKVREALMHYKSQRFIKPVRTYYDVMKHKTYERFGVFNLEDLGKYENF
ncbi:MAG: PIG-L deacetylase family protein [Promethearchaeia archaeon]